MTDEVMTSQKSKLYALLVGIADYASEIRLANGKVRFPRLYGCVSDVEKVKQYLEKDNGYDVKIQPLIDKEATKEAIVNAFRTHLSKATESDIVLIYFSGHGTQEYIDKSVFKTETDGKSECIVCYYNEHTKDDFLLADKELRWLINSISSRNPHIITIFDCCHSAGVTRDPAIEESGFPQVVEKRVPFVFPRRDWQSYIFNHISENEMKNKGEDILLPESAHIHRLFCPRTLFDIKKRY